MAQFSLFSLNMYSIFFVVNEGNISVDLSEKKKKNKFQWFRFWTQCERMHVVNQTGGKLKMKPNDVWIAKLFHRIDFNSLFAYMIYIYTYTSIYNAYDM